MCSSHYLYFFTRCFNTPTNLCFASYNSDKICTENKFLRKISEVTNYRIKFLTTFLTLTLKHILSITIKMYS